MPRRSGEAAKAGLIALRSNWSQCSQCASSERTSAAVGARRNSASPAPHRVQNLRRDTADVGFPPPLRDPRPGIRLAFSGFVPAKRFVYVLKDVEKAPHFYVGLTSDVEARLADHNMGRCPHTSSYRPWHLHVVIEFPDEHRAIRFEHYLKSGSGRAFAKRHFES